MTSDDTPRYPIESVDNALRLLLMFEQGDLVRVNAAARELGVASSTATRLMAMLQAHQLVRQDPKTRAYVVGNALVGLSLAVMRNFDIRTVARPHLEALSAATGETTTLAVLQGNQVTFIDAVESAREVRVASRVGMQLPAHCTSVGKALLADLTKEQLRVLYPKPKLIGLTEASIVSRSQLEDELAAVRERGYSLNHGESEDDIGSAAAAIRGRYGRASAAISVAGPLTRLGRRLDEFGAQAVATAAAIGESAT